MRLPVSRPLTVTCLAPLALLALLASGCASSFERQARADLGRSEQQLAEPRPATEARPAKFKGDLDAYIKYALEHSPELRATFEQWRASTYRVSRARRLPNPVFTYAYFVRSVETRVGPQRHKFRIQQAFPWPTRLSAGADAASLAARSAQKQYEAAALAVTRRVVEAYYQLWMVHKTRKVQADQKKILDHFSLVARGRLEVGQGSLADLGQIDLNRARVGDVLSGLGEAERRTSARLVAAVGAPEGTKTPVRDSEPAVGLPAETLESLRRAAHQHPRVIAMALMAKSRQELARSADAGNYPGFAVAAEYIETGEAQNPGMADSGKDPIIVSLSVSLPLWGGYSDDEAEALAESAAFRARETAARDQASSELEKALSSVRDSARKLRLYKKSLVPQALVVYESSIGGYQTGRSSLPTVLMAQRDLLELQLGEYQARADHAVAWARLEEVVGRPVKSRRSP